MREVKLLIVDDEDEIVDEFENSIKIYNRENKEIKYKPYIAKSFDKAKEILETYIIDTAIIDINLDSRGSGNFDGNSVIEEILKYLRVPIFVVSGTPNHLNDSFKDNAMIKSYTREADINEKLFERDIPNSIQSSTLAYFSRNGYLENKVAKFYWEHLSKTIEYWEKIAREKPQEIDKILSRHTLSCLNEKLYVNDNIGKFDEYHPGEMYIIPPIKQHYHTGDIIKKDGELFIILNPACDIVNMELHKPYKSKLRFYLLSKIIPISEIRKIQHSNNKDRANFIEDIKKNKSDSYHFLPIFTDIFSQCSDDGYVIDFQDLQIVQSGLDLAQSYNDIETYIKARDKFIVEYERVASISSPFLKDIIARFSRYYARQGQPDLMQH